MEQSVQPRVRSVAHPTRSGSVLHVGRRAVLKRGTDASTRELLREQAHFMQRVGCPFAPVRFISGGGYAMPLLRPWVASNHTGREVADRLVQARRLADSMLWRQTGEALPPHWKRLHCDYVRKLFMLHELPMHMLDRFYRRFEIACAVGIQDREYVIHGDLTLENTVTTPDSGDMLLIDPLPNRPYMPNTPTVDLGKLLQSARGWEVKQHHPSTHLSWNTRETELAVTYGLSEGVAFAAWYWYGVHCLRLLRYVSPSVRAFYILEMQNVSVRI